MDVPSMLHVPVVKHFRKDNYVFVVEGHIAFEVATHPSYWEAVHWATCPVISASCRGLCDGGIGGGGDGDEAAPVQASPGCSRAG